MPASRSVVAMIALLALRSPVLAVLYALIIGASGERSR